MFHAFHKYGRLAQLSIKQAYGFVQFHDAAACHNALEREQGQLIRGRKMRKFEPSKKNEQQ
jgi:nuclear polyadenylated RNA-binding protein 3